MKGTTASNILDGANAARGSDDVPAAQYNMITSPLASSSADVTTTATATATATDLPDQGDDGDDGDDLATGTKVGIGIGVIFAFIGAASCFAWAVMLYRHRKKRRLERANTLDSTKPPTNAPRVVSHVGKAELPAHSSTRSQSSLPTELSPIGARYEMSGDSNALHR